MTKAEYQEKVLTSLESIAASLKDMAESQKQIIESIPTKRKRKKRGVSDHKKLILSKIIKLRSKNETYQNIAQYLTKEDIPTLSGRGEWHAQTVQRLYMDNTEQS